MSVILTCNSGSTNTKLAVFDASTLERKAHIITHDLAETIEWLRSVGEWGITAIGHRVVHGGQDFTHPAQLNDDVESKLEALIPLAPLHQPAALLLVKEARKLYPNVPHIACFDTAFHSTMPEIERRLPLPRTLHNEGLMRYGFHGLSYQYIASILPKYAGEKAQGNIIVVHLGGGSSACAMKNLRSIACTMGFSTLDGLMMGSRCGALDPGVILYLLQEKHLSVKEVSDLLYNQSGLKGVSGIRGNMQELIKSKKSSAKEAIELYTRLAAKQIAGLTPALGGLDALVFTGGIGENAEPVRERILTSLSWIGDFKTYVIPTSEEQVIAISCQQHLT